MSVQGGTGSSSGTPVEPALVVDDLNGSYTDLPVLHDIKMMLSSSEVVCIMGRNGVGKTTLLRALMGLLPSASGKITFFGTDLSRWKPHLRARAGMAWLPQDDAIFSGLTVQEHLEIACGDRNIERAIDDIRELFPVLVDRLRQQALTLSGGERKMLGVAQAVLTQPRILLLDEPTEGVAPLVIKGMQEVIRSLSQSYPILLAEQNIDTALAIADRAYIIEKGSIVAEGAPQALYEDGVLHERLGL